nr:hypothetical protein [Mucilaginibacter sp. L294]
MKNILLKAISTGILSIATLTYFSGCKKDGPSNETILKNRISDVIPQKYLDTLKKLQFPINDGTNPPNMEGAYFANHLILKASNLPSDVIGNQFHDAKFKLFDQSIKDFGISLIGEHFLTLNDTSIVTAISGSGNNFTVYGKVKSTTGTKSAIFAIIISGTKDGNNIKNYTEGLINIDNSNGGTGVFLPEGKARIVYDSDLVSERINYDDEVSVTPKNNAIGLLNAAANK